MGPKETPGLSKLMQQNTAPTCHALLRTQLAPPERNIFLEAMTWKKNKLRLK